MKKRYLKRWAVFGLAPLSCLLVNLLPAVAAHGAGTGTTSQQATQPASQSSVIDVQKDKEKVSYTIGARPNDAAKDDADKAWKMLDNAGIDARGPHGKRPDNNR